MSMKAEFEQLIAARTTALRLHEFIASLRGISAENDQVLSKAQNLHASMEETTAAHAELLIEKVRAPLISAALKVRETSERYGLAALIDKCVNEHPDTPDKWRIPLRSAIRSEEAAQVLNAFSAFDNCHGMAMHSV